MSWYAKNQGDIQATVCLLGAAREMNLITDNIRNSYMWNVFASLVDSKKNTLVRDF